MHLSERVWRLEGALAKLPLRRVMTLVRRADGGLVVHNAIAADDATMAAIAALGEIRTLVVPGAQHRLDARAYHDRFPAARIVCPAGARAKVEQVVPVHAVYGEMPSDGVVELEPIDGTRAREGVLIVRDADGTTVVLNDLVFHMPDLAGVQGFVLKHITGSTGGVKITRLARLLLISDKRAVRAHLERLAALPGLRRIIVSHHETIEHAPGRVLDAVAATL